MKKNSWLKRNGLSIAFSLLMLFSLIGQIFTGWKEHNDFLGNYHKPALSMITYLTDGHFLQATFENWQSEFLSIFAIVFLSIYLRQTDSPQSKKVTAPHSKTVE